MAERANGSSSGLLREEIEALLPAALRGERVASTIARRLDVFLRASTVGERIEAWARIVDWTRPAGVSGLRRPAGSPRDSGRLEALLVALEGSAQIRSAVHEGLGRMLAETEGAPLFGETGLPSHRGFFSELGDRVMNRLLPRPQEDGDLAGLLGRLFPSDAHSDRFRQLSPELFHRIVKTVLPPDREGIWEPVRTDFADGFRLLAGRARAEGLAGRLRVRGRSRRVSESPFFRLDGASEVVAAAWLGNRDLGGAVAEWRRCATDCWAEMGAVRQRLETQGVSVDIVFGLDVIDRALKRMDLMIEIMEAPSERERSTAIHRLLARLVASHRQDRSVRHLAGGNLRMLARRIVDRTGQTGEHYIARDRREYRHIWLAAAGGGALTVLTAAVKMKIVGRGLPAFPEGVLASLNYAVSFLLLQTFGLILATKQPAMTAATLAAIVRERRGAHRTDEIVDYAAAIVRSQLAAATANVVVVAAGAYIFDLLWQLVAGRTYIDVDDAQHVFETLSPLDSLTVLYAAETGVLLWLASVVGGWFDNWAAYHRLPRAVAEHPSLRRFGRDRMRRIGEAISRNASGWATSVSLGFLLGLTPAFGLFLGLPLDVRHVTLSTGMLALAAATSHQKWVGQGVLIRAIAGIGVMFVLNLSVSFLLSLANAARAYDLPRRDFAEILRRLGARMVRSPGQFLRPPRSGGAGSVGAAQA
jgi:site-specific recombinase